MTILHLALAADWDAAQADGQYRVSTLGRTLEEEGFIHASADQAQLDKVAEMFYRHVSEPLLVLEIDTTRLGCPLIFEVPDGATEAFPHIYGPLPCDAVVSVTPFSWSGSALA